MTDDAELLLRYAQTRDERAFAELVRRHLGLVYHAALRQCGGDAHRAEDVAQAVFTDLARKAEKLASRPVLAGWLYTSTRYAAAQAVRGEVRRQAREQEAHSMNEILSDNSAAAVAEWERLRPQIDDALHALGERDREAVLLRFFEGRSFAEIGAGLSLSEDAARMRVERALEKLRTVLVRRGITSTTTALGVALANQAAATAPTGVAASVTGAALTGAAASGSAVAWLALLTMSKIKVGIVSAIVIAATVPAILEVRANRVLATEVAALRAGGDDLASLRKETKQLDGALAGATAGQPNGDELARLRARVAVLQKRPAGVTDANLKPASTWKNLGWATPEAALETVMWAAQAGITEELVRNMRWIGEARAPAEAAFAKLPEALRARYGNADRLFGEFVFGSRGKENVEAAAGNHDKVAAFQVLDITEDLKRGGMRVRRWEQMASGREGERTDTFLPDGAQFVFGERRWTERGWQGIIDQIDPATGAFRPRKLVPMDPETGRPVQPAR